MARVTAILKALKPLEMLGTKASAAMNFKFRNQAKPAAARPSILAQ
jgi:hypothetical protein